MSDYSFPFVVSELFEKKYICYYCEVIQCIRVVVAFQEQILQDQMALGEEMAEVWHEDDPRPLDPDISPDAIEASLPRMVSW